VIDVGTVVDESLYGQIERRNGLGKNQFDIENLALFVPDGNFMLDAAVDDDIFSRRNCGGRLFPRARIRIDDVDFSVIDIHDFHDTVMSVKFHVKILINALIIVFYIKKIKII